MVLTGDLAAGFCGGAVTDAVFYIADSHKTQSQAGRPLSLARMTRGLLPLSLTGSAPALAVFFALYTPMQETLGGGAGATAVAAMAATIPSTLVGVPADTVKKQLVVGKYPSATAAALGVLRTQGPAGLFRGWQANVGRDVPFAVLKMSLYEGLAAMYKSLRGHVALGEPLGTLDHGVVGFASGGVAAICTNPLDVINTRIKAGSLARDGASMLQVGRSVAAREGARALFAGLTPRVLIMGGGSTVFWTVHASTKRWMERGQISTS